MSVRLVIAALVAMLNADVAYAADGEALFNEHCSACHDKGGVGVPGLTPPLVSSVMRNAAGTMPDYVPLVVLNGLSGRIEVAGQMYFSAMPAQPQLSDEQIAAIGGYIQGTLNVAEGAVALDAAGVSALREPKVGHADLRALRAELE